MHWESEPIKCEDMNICNGEFVRHGFLCVVAVVMAFKTTISRTTKIPNHTTKSTSSPTLPSRCRLPTRRPRTQNTCRPTSKQRRTMTGLLNSLKNGSPILDPQNPLNKALHAECLSAHSLHSPPMQAKSTPFLKRGRKKLRLGR